MKSLYKKVLFLLTVVILSYSCSKDDYYIDGGRHTAQFDGNALQYLEAKSREFDTIATIIKLAGLEDMFQNDTITFFAPRDENIKDLIGNVDKENSVNNNLYFLGRDTIKTLADVDSVIWRKYLMRYVFRGKRQLKDYPQIDFDIQNVYPGENYASYDGSSVSNIGVVFNDAGGVKYAGYRKLYISYIPNLSAPTNRIIVPVASSDIEPTNAIIHALDYTKAPFGFNREIVTDIQNSKR